MKILVITAAILFANIVNAQEKISEPSIEESPTEQNVQKNIIKTNVTAYIFRNYNIAYERSIKKWFSINVSYGGVPKGKVPFINSFLSDEDQKDFKDIQISNSAFTIEPRFYLGAGYGKGFYIAPYYRNTQTKVENFTYNFDYDNGITMETIPIAVSGKASGNSAGLMIGAQWFLGKKDNWVLDLWIAGAHYGKGKGEFTGKTNRILSPQEQQQLKESLEGQDIPVIEYTVTTNSNGAKINLDGPWAGLRSGLSFGYRF